MDILWGRNHQACQALQRHLISDRNRIAVKDFSKSLSVVQGWFEGHGLMEPHANHTCHRHKFLIIIMASNIALIWFIQWRPRRFNIQYFPARCCGTTFFDYDTNSFIIAPHNGLRYAANQTRNTGANPFYFFDKCTWFLNEHYKTHVSCLRTLVSRPEFEPALWSWTLKCSYLISQDKSRYITWLWKCGSCP